MSSRDQRASAVALLTCHNRKDKSLACLRSLLSQRSSLDVKVFLVDDGSTDGTGQAVKREFPEVTVVRGSGNLFWAGGMIAADHASRHIERDFTLWINDDVVLAPHALDQLLSVYESRMSEGFAEVVVGGAFQDPASGATSYGGLRRQSKLRPLKFTLLEPQLFAISCDVVHGNLVLIPEVVREKVGGLDPCYSHGIADFDFCLRALELGVEVWLAPGHVGDCAPNVPRKSYAKMTSLAESLREVASVKHLPPKEWKIFARRHAGVAWPIYWLSPYARVLGSALRGAAKK